MSTSSQRAAPHIVRREAVFSTPWFDVVAKQVAGNSSDRPFYSLQLSDYVCIVALSAGGEILLVRQYRPAVEKYTLELPSGRIEAGEDPVDAARRELVEETGYVAGEVELLAKLLPDVGRLANRMWCYFAGDVTLHPAQPEREPGVELVACKLEDFTPLILREQFDHALHLAAILSAVMKQKLPLPYAK